MFSNPLAVWANYDMKNLKSDFFAGLSTAILATPQNMAYALIAGVNPIYGLYSSIVGMISSTFFGESRYMVVAPCNMIVLAIYSSLNSLAIVNDSNYLQAVFLLTFLVGVVQIILASLKLGNLVSYISQSVIVGLTSAVAIIIGLGQLSNLLGLNIENGSNIFETIYYIMTNISEANFYALALGIITMGLIIIVKRSKIKLPAYAVAIVTAAIIVYLFDLSGELAVVEGVSATLPSFNLIELDFELFTALLNSALSIAILSFIQVLSILKFMEKKSGEEVEINREFFNQGIINIICSFFSSFVVTASFTKSFANYSAGAKTRISEFVGGLLIISFILIFSSFISYIPISALAGLVIVVAYSMIDLTEIKKSCTITKFDAIIFSTTFFVTLLAPRIDYAIYLGIIISFLLVLKDNSKVDYCHIDYNEQKEEFIKQEVKKNTNNGYVIINISGELHFNTAKDLREKFEYSFKKEKNFIIRLYGVEDIDLTTIKAINEFIDRVLNNKGDIYLTSMTDDLYLAFKEAKTIEKIGDDHVFWLKKNIFSATEEAVKEVKS